MGQLLFFILLIFGGSAAVGSVKIINQGDKALVETLGKYNGRTLEPGLNWVVPFFDRVAYRQTVREQVLDIPPQQCITRDNVSISVDAVVYWRIMDLEKACYKVNNLQAAMENLVRTQIRSEMGKLELDQTFTARTEVNELLLRELDIATDPWGVKVTRVELRDICPAKAVMDAMELQMSAERQKRAAILSSEGERESAINSARGRAEAEVLAAQAHQKALVLRAQAEREAQVLKAHATAEALQILAKILKADPEAKEVLQYLLAQHYIDMGTTIGNSDSSKVMFMDPRTIPATLEGMRSLISDGDR
ncbi:SPFH domain-containing protein [Lyngbya sp. CCY1209]|jgi:regulator of protease activity HflC (stomatin/prohibitin superfamily)|uniref:SPFH domain-containing protein n=1 Tax=Lyngbya sp. CCY1209 TaxID=2886103 RepID=UPI002D1FF1A7|nr:SPFH domain-containing protein [Lyngbya sp. CCY1209]MEB3883940.1 SPFH/Band 7/PHB domain protein [Lyngbya sp. CCY1209]